MFVGVSILLLVLSSSTDAFLTNTLISSLSGTYLTATCNCFDRTIFCPFLQHKCTNDHSVRVMCPVRCKLCTECPDKVLPTVIPTVKACTLDCKDVTATALCAHFKSLGYCTFTRGLCKKTCEDCKECDLPYNKLPPCKPDCADQYPPKDCTFWKSRSFCNHDGDYPDVRYVCQRTCAVCRRCDNDSHKTT